MTETPAIAKARAEGRVLLTEVESKRLLRDAGIPVTDTRLAGSKAEAQAIAKELGYPVVLKIVSPEITHKSDAGGVKLKLGDAGAVAAAYDEIIASAKKAAPQASIAGVSVQPMAKAGTEIILGATKDPQFGPVVMFGLGGIFVEVMKDVSFRIVPLAARDAAQMVREIKGFPVLQGVRGQEPADLAAIERAIMQLSAFAEKHPEIKEIDLNPVLVYRSGLIAVDARVVLEAK
ncbi:MAG: acetyl-CoA synthetase [Dehalococcoidia bacterium]|nr:acetyl-CoA synthetase [Dehalococcoidia bacterium]